MDEVVAEEPVNMMDEDREGEDKIEYYAPVEKRKTYGHMLIKCPKCKTISILQREGLEKVYEQHDPKGVQTERPSKEKLKGRNDE